MFLIVGFRTLQALAAICSIWGVWNGYQASRIMSSDGSLTFVDQISVFVPLIMGAVSYVGSILTGKKIGTDNELTQALRAWLFNKDDKTTTLRLTIAVIMTLREIFKNNVEVQKILSSLVDAIRREVFSEDVVIDQIVNANPVVNASKVK